jgi:hypothetical protein
VNDFQTLVLKWIDEQNQLYQRLIENKKARYLKEKKAWSEQEVSPQTQRIQLLTTLRTSFVAELAFGKAHGQDLLNLANIVYNEAGKTNRASKVAIAYAWFNRTRGVMREPKNDAEVSHYIPLLQRWNELSNDVLRLSFLQNFVPSLSAARQRLEDREPTKNDPTRGATHWVSPIGLKPFKNQPDRYSRTVGKALQRAFPLWARSNSDPEVAKMKKSNQLKANFAELTLPGIDQTDFLFYVGVSY